MAQALGEHALDLHAFIERMPDGVFVAGSDGKYIDVNPAACRLVGYSREELLALSIVDLVSPEDLERQSKLTKSILEGGGEISEWQLRRKDGTIIPVELSASALPDGRLLGFIRDISARKRFEDERQVFVSFLENSRDFIGIADPSGKPIYVNPAGRRMVGLPPDYPVEQTKIPEYYPPEQRPLASEVIVKSMVEHGYWSGETYFRNWNTGDAIPVSDEHFLIRDLSGQRVIGMGTITRDITVRKREEAALHELLAQNALLRRAADQVPSLLAYWDAEQRCRYANRAYEKWFGVSPQTLIGKHISELLGPLYALNRPYIEGALRGMAQQFEREIPSPDAGPSRHSVAYYIPDTQEGIVRGFFVLVSDVSELKRAELAARESEAKCSGIISISADAIVSIDQEQRIGIFNDGAERIFGYSRAEALGMPLERLIPKRAREAHREHVERFASDDMSARQMGEQLTAISGLRKNGQEFPAEAAISKLRVSDKTILTVALRDITERKQIEKEQQFLAKAGAVLSSSLDYEQTLSAVAQMVVGDFADWCVVDVMETPNSLMRLKVACADPSKAEICTRLEQIRLDPTRPYLLHQVVQTRQPLLLENLTDEYLVARAQGPEHLQALRSLAPKSLMAVPLLAHGQLVGALSFISSTPERSFGERDLRFSRALADRAALALENSKLYRIAQRAIQSRDEMMGIVAHDLRNPLGAIALHTSLLRRGGREPERRSERPLDLIARATTRMKMLIQDLLDVTRIEAGQFAIDQTRLSTHKIVLDALESQQMTADSALVDLHRQVENEVPEVWGDEQRLLQAFENLVGNAVKFTSAGGRITLGAASRGEEVLFWVADTGRGIPAEDLPHVFDRFWQGRKEERRGTGLGLSIVKGIVDAHGGRIWAESALGKGTTFFFTIPTERQAQARSSEAEPQTH